MPELPCRCISRVCRQDHKTPLRSGATAQARWRATSSTSIAGLARKTKPKTEVMIIEIYSWMSCMSVGAPAAVLKSDGIVYLASSNRDNVRM